MIGKLSTLVATRAASSSPSGIWIRYRATQDGSHVLWSFFRVAKIIVVVIVVYSFPFLSLSGSISSQASKFFLPQFHQSLRCFLWEVTLDTVTCFVI